MEILLNDLVEVSVLCTSDFISFGSTGHGMPPRSKGYRILDKTVPFYVWLSVLIEDFLEVLWGGRKGDPFKKYWNRPSLIAALTPLTAVLDGKLTGWDYNSFPAGEAKEDYIRHLLTMIVGSLNASPPLLAPSTKTITWDVFVSQRPEDCFRLYLLNKGVKHYIHGTSGSPIRIPLRTKLYFDVPVNFTKARWEIVELKSGQIVNAQVPQKYQKKITTSEFKMVNHQWAPRETYRIQLTLTNQVGETPLESFVEIT